MTTTTNEADNITVYPVFENERVTFKVQNDYHLQKMGIGAVCVNIQEVEKLKHLKHVHHQIVVPCASYIIVHNNVDRDEGFAAVLILTNSVTLSNNDVLFSIVYPEPFKITVPVEVHAAPEDRVNANENEQKSENQEDVVSSSISDNEIAKRPALFEKYYKQ
ncbi:tlp20 [Hyphantria cunea granulovirus]|uniref:Tlp20 n=1 Tax=Hyphantria cunea granulovirus TaxID=307448 RepID=A0AAE5YIY1_9BBAC|nr:tlp20 [Hyphantria cunea granulovirus]QBQ01643.1 tlp20 [Hyphantria cunea granulovirus]